MRGNARRSTRVAVALVALAGVCAACTSAPVDAPAGTHDAGVCALRVTLGMGDRASFAPLADGDAVPIVLGEQGLLMVWLSLEVAGSSTDRVDVAWRTVTDTGLAVEQRDRYAPLVLTGPDTGVVEGWILFYEGVLAPQMMGHPADIDLIVRVGECTASTRVRVTLRDGGS